MTCSACGGTGIVGGRSCPRRGCPGKQASLFEHAATAGLARASDPETSKVAAKRLDVRMRQDEVLVALLHRSVSSTAAELQETLRGYGMHREKNEVGSRLSELHNLGLTRKVGPKLGNRGRQVATWALTSEGIVEARKAQEAFGAVA